jgi:hypothetical protein
MPVLCVLVRTADTCVVVDTGEAVDQPLAGSAASGRPAALLPQPAHPGPRRDRGPARLRRLGVDPRSIDTVQQDAALVGLHPAGSLVDLLDGQAVPADWQDAEQQHPRPDRFALTPR